MDSYNEKDKEKETATIIEKRPFFIVESEHISHGTLNRNRRHLFLSIDFAKRSHIEFTRGALTKYGICTIEDTPFYLCLLRKE